MIDQDACKRREDRRSVELQAVIHRRDGSRALAAVRDLSYGGCQLSGGKTFEAAERITLVVPTLGEIDAQVRWSKGEAVGAQFGGVSPWDEGVEAPARNAQSYARHVNFGSRRTFGRKGHAA